MLTLLSKVPLWAWLSAGLLASLGLNAYVLRALAVAKSECDAAIATERLQSTLAAYEHRSGVQALITEQARSDSRELLERLDAIADAQESVVSRYRAYVGKLPPLPANCGPGQPRVDAFNNAFEGTR